MKLYQFLLVISKCVGIEIWFNGEKLYGGIKGNVSWSFAENYNVKHVTVTPGNKLFIEVG